MSVVTNFAKKLWGRGEVPWLAATSSPGQHFAVCLLDNTIDLSDAAVAADYKFLSELAATAEVSGTGYTAGYGNKGAATGAGGSAGGAARQEVVLIDPTQDDTNNLSAWGIRNPVWSALNGFSVYHGVVYAHEGTYDGVAVSADANAPILCINTLSPFKTMQGNDFTLEFGTVSGDDGVAINGTQP